MMLTKRVLRTAATVQRFVPATTSQRFAVASLQQQQQQQQQRRTLCAGDFPLRGVGASNYPTMSLVDVIEREIDDEIIECENYEKESDFSEIRRDVAEHFTIDDQEGTGEVRLTAQHGGGGEQITISFHCQDLHRIERNDWEIHEDEVEDDSELDMDDDDEFQDATNFKVEVKKGSSSLVFTCFAFDTVNIEAIRHQTGVSSSPTSKSRSLLGSTILGEFYEGPIFEELDSDLQDSFYDYLAERHIDDNLAVFIQMYGEYKEQKEFTEWLRSVGKFVQ
jgi:complement component 1 Q subcomponent-binding protein